MASDFVVWHCVKEGILPLHRIDDISLADADAASSMLTAWNRAAQPPKGSKS